jgi:catechol 2,3-dioxygenase
MSPLPVCWLRSVDLDVPDLAVAEAFYTDAWKLRVVARTPRAVWLRATGDDHHVLALHQAERAALRCVTLRAGTRADLDGVARRAIEWGCTLLQPVGPDAGPAGGVSVVFREPQGTALRIVHGDLRHDDGAEAANVPHRLSHVNINAIDVNRSMTFFATVLGMIPTDRSKLMGFVRCNADHHAIVLADAPVNGLNHIAFMLPDLESVMRGAGNLVSAGVPIAWGVGRHGPGNNVFAYFLDPFDVVVEYTAEVLQVDDSYRFGGPEAWNWPPGRSDHWGIAPPKPERVKHAQLATPHARDWVA